MDFHAFNAPIIDEFRANGGKVGGMFEGSPMLLLTTTGAKTGRRTTTPLVYAEQDGRCFIFGSKAGADTHPAWYHNLTANPQVTVEIGTDKFEARAVEVKGDERDQIYASQAARFPNFAEYQAKTSRVIPVVALESVRASAVAKREARKKELLAMSDEEYGRAWAEAMVAHLNAPDPPDVE